MIAVNYIINQLKTLHYKFPNSNMRYEFRENTKTHLIEVTPLEFYNNESYMNAELELEELFLKEFSEEIIFISSDSLTKIIQPNFEIFRVKEVIFELNFNSEYNLNSFQELFQNNYETTNNFSLAA